MGYALAEACANRGAEVILVSGPVSLSTHHPAIKRIDVESADEMYEATVQAFQEANAAILCAAVADYRPENKAEQKIKREKDEELLLRLVANKDIAAALGSMKKDGQVLVGFALETQNGVQHATGKLERKNLDFIVLNSLSDAGAGFRCDTNKVSILERNGLITEYALKSKTEVAGDIVNKLVDYLR